MKARVAGSALNGMAARLLRAMVRTGIAHEGDQLGYELGSVTNGVGSVVVLRRVDVIDRQPFGSFYWGRSARELFDAMHTMAVALECVPDR